MRTIFRFIFYLFIGLFFNINSDSIDLSNNINKDYFFKLNIPKIGLNQSVYEFNSLNNDVDKGIYLVKKYNFSSLKGSLILASHSGSSSISYFKNLDLLDLDDSVFVVYNDNYYYYTITNRYVINKTGKFNYKNDDKTIYLITCDKKNDKKQLVFKGKLLKIAKKSTFF